MNIEDEIYDLAASRLAHQTIIAELCHGLIAYDPRLRDIIAKSFDHASNHVEDLAIRFGKSASPQHTVKALRVVEELRTVVLNN